MVYIDLPCFIVLIVVDAVNIDDFLYVLYIHAFYGFGRSVGILYPRSTPVPCDCSYYICSSS